MNFHHIDPVIFSLGPLQVRWYGLMYAIGFIASFYLVKLQIKKFGCKKLGEQIEDLNITLILCLILGGRLGYVIFYNLPHYLAHPLEIPAIWAGGMSFHGACLTLLIGGGMFCYIKKISFWQAADLYAATAPIGLGLGRIGNFINGELYGRVSDVPWAMVFPYGGNLPRHPSQLYEFFLEGIVLFILLWSNHARPWRQEKLWPHGSIIALFLIGYGILRILAEFFREPDQQLGYLAGHLTMGQTLSAAMIIIGITIWAGRIKSGQR
ncbi:MAG: prolipoprotein diacylglyceryl transferase [Deltaproteobacteria bacterium]|nr:MAG: prolipoprotein diacylglyceryl transferase [Deltaproteobacteria bacterium]